MPLRAVRLCGRTYDPRKPSGRPSRWNDTGQLVLYLAEHFGTAVLESVVHAGPAAPPPAHASWADIPDIVSRETLAPAALSAGWEDPDDLAAARAVGSAWYTAAKSAILIVPSVPGRPFERNVVINTTHPDAALIAWSPPGMIPWDPRLFA